VPVSWTDVAAAHPELLIHAPCGFSRERAQVEAHKVSEEIDAVGADRVVVLDGSAYFNRPGPRLVDSLELLLANRAATTDLERAMGIEPT
jgi:iron complex transport system substrate-binding protein